jgi:hypothetical protein
MPVGSNLPKMAIWGKYWSPFHGSYQWKYGWSAAQKRRYFHYWESQNSSAALDCITRSANATWWDWADGSHPFFWRWNPEYAATVRDGLKLWYKGTAPKHFVPQKYEPDPARKEKIRLKLLKVLAGNVASLTHFFAVAKGDEDIRMVYNGTSSGLNSHLWCTWFALATISTMLRALEPGTFMGDLDVGEMFLNFMLETRCSYLAGVDLSKYIQELGGNPRHWARWGRCGMGFRPSPYQTTQAIGWAKEMMMGDPLDATNVFQWSSVRLNLPGLPEYDPRVQWVLEGS